MAFHATRPVGEERNPWQAFSAAVAAAQALNAGGAGAEVLQGVLRQARERLAVRGGGLALWGCDRAGIRQDSSSRLEARNALEQLRAGLAELDSSPAR